MASIPWESRYDPYLQDESKLRGHADSICFPRSEEELCAIIHDCHDASQPIIIQGGKTGIVGACVPMGGLILNLSKMNRPLSIQQDDRGQFFLTVEAGYPLSDLHTDLDRRQFEWRDASTIAEKVWNAFRNAPPLFWPPDPSETSALLGGIAAMNAAGPCAFRYGKAADHIHAIRVICADGEIWEIARGQYKAKDQTLPLPSNKNLSIDPTAIGLDENADLVDFFLGSEGMLGAISSLTLRLSTKPAQIWGICFFFLEESSAAAFVEETLQSQIDVLAAMDFLDRASIEAAQTLKETATKLQELPDTPTDAAAMIFLELHHDSETAIENAAELLMEIAIQHGSDIDSSWALSGDGEMEKLRAFRHAVPESINAKMEAYCLDVPVLHKLASDLAFPATPFPALIDRYRADLAQSQLTAFLFGHAAKKHLHVNFLPKNQDEMAQAQSIVEKWTKHAVSDGSAIAEENGIGKLKKGLFSRLASPAQKEAFQTLKKQLDPTNIWNPRNYFEPEIK